MLTPAGGSPKIIDLSIRSPPELAFRGESDEGSSRDALTGHSTLNFKQQSAFHFKYRRLREGCGADERVPKLCLKLFRRALLIVMEIIIMLATLC